MGVEVGGKSLCVCVCVSVCMSVTAISQKLLGRLQPNFAHHYEICSSCALRKIVTSYQEKFDRSYANHKIRRKYYWIFIKISEYLFFSTGRCCIVFGENRDSLIIQNGGPKFSKFAYLSKISQFCSDFKTKCIFVISKIV